MRRVLLRSAAVFIVGAAVLAGILYYASTVDGRPPAVDSISLTQHLSTDDTVALTTSSLDVSFSEPVDTDTAESAFRLDPAVRGSFSWSGSTMVFTPIDPLPLQTQFSASIGPGVRDRAGNTSSQASQPFDFTTVGQPRVIGSDPDDGARQVALDAPITITFSTLMDTASVSDALTVKPEMDFRLRWSGEQLTIVPSQPLEPGRSYFIRIGEGAEAIGGASLARPFALRFWTVPAGIEPVRLVPAGDAQGIAVTTPIAIFFDRAIDPASVSNELLTTTPSIAGTLELIAPPGAAGMSDQAARILRFQPSGPLPPNTTFEVTLSGDLRSADGAPLVRPVSWSFITGAPTPTLGNQILFLSDRSGVSNLWAMNPEGTGQHQLSAELSDVVSYAVAPDGASFVVGDGAGLVEQRADGSSRRVLTQDGHLEFDAAYSPDGGQIVFGRADALTGASEGLWVRAQGGGDETRVELPDELTATPLPSATPGEAAPLLRAPVYSPDGGALAFVVGAERVGVLELPSARLTTVPFDATATPVWLPDSSGVLLNGLPADVQPGAPPSPGQPLLPISAATRGLSGADLGGLRLVRLDRSGTTTVDIGLPFGAALPAVDGDGLIAYLQLGTPPAGDGGSVWVTRDGEGSGSRVTPPGVAVASVGFAPDPSRVVVARPEGIWIFEVRTQTGVQRSPDGWQPRWIP